MTLDLGLVLGGLAVIFALFAFGWWKGGGGGKGGS